MREIGGWNAPIDPRPILDFFHVTLSPSLNLASLDIWLLWALVFGVPLLILGVIGIVLLSGTLNLNQIVRDQEGSFLDWYVFRQPLGALIFFIAATAEGARTPFDLTEADSEIVAGFATEYSGMRFGFFFFAEYVNVFILSALTVVLFFGGWNAPITRGPSSISFISAR